MASSFSAQVGAWALQTRQRMEAGVRDAAQTVANDVRRPKAAGGNMPVLTGNLRRSLMASTAQMPSVQAGDVIFTNSDGQVTLTIAGMQLGQTIYLGFQAAYARRREYGFDGADALGRYYSESGDGFVRLTAQRWPQIVEASARRIQGRVEARAAFAAGQT